MAGHAEIIVTTDTADGHARLTVDNTGPPVPAYEIPGLFEPFRRLATTERLADSIEASTSRGAGLGLSIVRSVAHAHGGDVHATPEKAAASASRCGCLRRPRRRSEDVGRTHHAPHNTQPCRRLGVPPNAGSERSWVGS